MSAIRMQYEEVWLESGGHANVLLCMTDSHRCYLLLIESGGQTNVLSYMTDKERGIILESGGQASSAVVYDGQGRISYLSF